MAIIRLGREWAMAPPDLPFTHVLDANNDGVGMVIYPHKSGTINKIGFYAAVTGTPPTYRVALESVNARAPSGTILGAANDAYVDITPTVTGWQEGTLVTPLAVTPATELAVTIRYQTGTIDASNCITVTYGAEQVGGAQTALPYTLTLTAGTWAPLSTRFPAFSPRYTDGEYLRSCWLVGGAGAAIALTSSSNPFHAGNMWTQPFTGYLAGVRGVVYGTTGDWTLSIFEDANTTPIATKLVDCDHMTQAASAILPVFMPLAPTLCREGHTYRATIKAESATAASVYTWVWHHSDARASSIGNLQKTTSPSTVAWTDDATRAALLFPEFEEWIKESNAGGGGNWLRSTAGSRRAQAARRRWFRGW